MAHPRLPYFVTAATALVALASWTHACEPRSQGNAVEAQTVLPLSSKAKEASSHDQEPNFADLVDKVRGSVVNITSKRVVTMREVNPFEEFFGPLFGRRHRQPDEIRRIERALGSGFIVDPEGYVVTNFHVIQGSDDVSVRLYDGRDFDADIIGRDEKTDLALLKLRDASDLPVAQLGSSSEVRVGEFVLAIGNPFGLGNTVTHGIVSATGRVLGAGPYDDFVQTDASINPGNSGGPLFDMNGKVIGVSSMMEAHGRGIGFAIPVDDVHDVIPQLRATGHVERGRLGVVFQPVTSAIASAIGLKSAGGAMVVDVEPDGPADKAGLRPGDVVLDVDKQPIENPEQLARAVASHKPGTVISLRIYREHHEHTLEATLGKAEEPQPLAESPKKPKKPMGGGPAPNVPQLGMSVDDARGGGARIDNVQPGGPADGVLLPGDVIVEMNGSQVGDAKELRRLAKKASGPAALLRVRREGEERYVGLPLRK